MALQANTYESVINFIDGNLGYSLNKKKLKQWIYRNKLTQPYVARAMRISVDGFKGKLKSFFILNSLLLLSIKLFSIFDYSITNKVFEQILFLPFNIDLT